MFNGSARAGVGNSINPGAGRIASYDDFDVRQTMSNVKLA
jgi:hypothetical protein